MNNKKHLFAIPLLFVLLASSANVAAREVSEINIAPNMQVICRGAGDFKLLLSKVEDNVKDLGWRTLKLSNMPLSTGGSSLQVVKTTVMPCWTKGSSSGCGDESNVFENAEYGWYLQLNLDAGDIQIGPNHYKIQCNVDIE